MERKKEVLQNINEKELKIRDRENLVATLTEESIAIDVDKEENNKMRWQDKMADTITAFIGSWKFIIGFTSFLLLWIFMNLFFLSLDPYPFILLNLFLSCFAALQAPIIMMSENRSSKRNQLKEKNDFCVDLKSELILEELYEKVNKLLERQQK